MYYVVYNSCQSKYTQILLAQHRLLRETTHHCDTLNFTFIYMRAMNQNRLTEQLTGYLQNSS